jgi:hypothetical protein
MLTILQKKFGQFLVHLRMIAHHGFAGTNLDDKSFNNYLY